MIHTESEAASLLRVSERIECCVSRCFIGGRDRDRTCDPFHVNETVTHAIKCLGAHQSHKTARISARCVLAAC